MKSVKQISKIVRCSIVGDSFVGKTSLIKAFLKDEKVEDLTSTVFDNFAGDVPLADGNCTVSIFDTTGHHDLDGLRQFPYAQSDVVLVCYSATDRSSFDNVSEFWIPEIKRHTKKGTPVVLVETKSDLNNAKFTTVTPNERVLLSNKIGAFSLVETSAFDYKNISKLFEIVAMKGMSKRRNIISRLFRRRKAYPTQTVHGCIKPLLTVCR